MNRRLDQREAEREPDRKAQRPHAVRRDAGERQLDHAAQRELAVAALPRAARIRHGDERKAEPAHQPAQEDVLVLQPVHNIDHGAIEQHVIGAARLDAHVADRVEHTIVKLRGEPLAGRLRASSSRSRRDDLGAASPRRNQLRDQFGRMLEVGIHHDHGASARVAHARAQRRLMAEVARERDVADRGVACGRADRRERAVGGAVIDEDDLIRSVRAPSRCAIAAAIGAMLPASLWAGSTIEISGAAPIHDLSVIICAVDADASPGFSSPRRRNVEHFPPALCIPEIARIGA